MTPRQQSREDAYSMALVWCVKVFFSAVEVTGMIAGLMLVKAGHDLVGWVTFIVCSIMFISSVLWSGWMILCWMITQLRRAWREGDRP